MAMKVPRKRLIPILLILSAHRIVSLALGISKRNACIALVANRFFQKDSAIAVVTTSPQESQQQPPLSLQHLNVEDDIVQLLDLRWKFSFVILQLHLNNGTDSTCPDRLENYPTLGYFVIVGNGNEIATSIQSFCFVGLTNYRTKLVVFLNTEPENAEKNVQNVLERFWEHNHQNVIVLVTNPREDLDVYTWFPLQEDSRPKIVDECDGQLFRYDTPLFPMKIPHDLNGKQLRVGMMRTPPYTCKRIGGGYAGIDVEMMEAIASALNFTLDYVLVERLRRTNDSEHGYWNGQIGPWKTILLRAVAGEIDIALGGFTLEPKAIDVLGYTPSYYRDSSGVFATTDPIPAHDMAAWIAMAIPLAVVVQFCSAVAMYLLERRDNPQRSDFGRLLMMVWSLLTESSDNISRLCSRQALLWAVCAFYTINVNTAHRCLLTSVLARPLYAEKIQTLEDIVRYSTPCLLHGEPKTGHEAELLSRENELRPLVSPEVIAKILKTVVSCNEPLYRCLVPFLSVPQYSLYAYNLDMQFIQSSLPNHPFHTVTRDLYFPEIAIYTRRNFFLTPKMSMMIHRSAQAGLINYWLRKSLKNSRLCSLTGSHWSQLVQADANGSYSKHHPDNLHQPLTMKRMEIQFRLLGAGLLVAGASFIVELLSVTRKCQCVFARFRGCHQTMVKGRI